MSLDEELLPFLLHRIDGHFQLVTLKASLIIPANILLLGLVLGNRKPVNPEGEPLPLFEALLTVEGFLIFLASASGIISLLFAARATAAFLKGGSTEGSYESLLFFGSIARKSPEVFYKETNGRRLNDISEDLARQTHLLSRNLLFKFKQVNRSIFFLITGSLSAVLHMLLTQGL